MLSRRVENVPEASKFLRIHITKIATDRYNEETNPDGYVPLSISENVLGRMTLETSQAVVLTDAGGYGSPRGQEWFRKVLAKYLTAEICGCLVEPEHLSVFAGAVSCMQLLVYAIADAGEGIMIPAPHWPGFYPLIESQNKCVRIPVDFNLENPAEAIDPDKLKAVYDGAVSRGIKVRALLFSNPQNPTGYVHSKEAIVACLAFAKERNMHVICDEAYASCIFQETVPFFSMANFVSDSVHVVWTMSKDLGLSGIRVGTMYTRNSSLNDRILYSIGHPMESSILAQRALFHLLKDPHATKNYMKRNKAILASAWHQVRTTLDTYHIPHLEPSAGLFVMLDLRTYRSNRPKTDEEFVINLVHTINVGFTPGSAMGCKQSGWIRACFAFNPIPHTITALHRLGKHLQLQPHTITLPNPSPPSPALSSPQND